MGKSTSGVTALSERRLNSMSSALEPIWERLLANTIHERIRSSEEQLAWGRDLTYLRLGGRLRHTHKTSRESNARKQFVSLPCSKIVQGVVKVYHTSQDAHEKMR